MSGLVHSILQYCSTALLYSVFPLAGGDPAGVSLQGALHESGRRSENRGGEGACCFPKLSG